jgi:uncharacterized protein (DUF305 family)
MVSHVAADSVGRVDQGVESRDDSDETVSDAQSDRFMRWTLVGLGVVVLIVAVAAVATWVAGSNDDDPDFGAVEVGFLQDMIDHHEQALLISNTLLEANPDGDAASYARDVILFQTRDIGRMETWLDDAGYTRGSPDRTAMVWMGEPTSVEAMPGLATPEQLQELAASTGADADRQFFELMSAHHLGGVHMADYAADHTELPWLRTFAEAVSYGQRIEVVEYEQAMERYGLTAG